MFSNTGPLTLLPYHVSPSPYLYLKCHLPTCLPVWITRKLLIFQSLAKRSFLRESFSNACSIWQTYTCPVLILYLVSTSFVANTSRHHIMHASYHVNHIVILYSLYNDLLEEKDNNLPSFYGQCLSVCWVQSRFTGHWMDGWGWMAGQMTSSLWNGTYCEV